MRKLRRIVKVLLSYFLFYSGILPLLSGREKKGEFRILMYHHVTEKGDGGLPVSVFRKQIGWVKKHYRIMGIKDLLLFQKEGKEIPKGAMAVTFDDGYRDFLTGAYPVLKKKNIPVTLFCVVECLERKPLWTESLKVWFEETSLKTLDLSLTGNRYSFFLGTREQKTGSLDRLKELLKHVSDMERRVKLSEIRGKLLEGEETGEEPSSMLSWEEVLKLSEDHIEIGAHTMSHPILSRVSKEEAHRQISESKEHLEKRLKRTIHLFSYPNGKAEDFTDEIRDMVEELGFLGACTTIEGTNDSSSDPYVLKRVATWEKSLPVFACDLEGCFDFLKGTQS